MTIIEIVILSIALSIDSFAVSFSGAVSMGRSDWKKITGVSFVLAIVQAGFFIGGYYTGDAIGALVREYGKYLGFSILLVLGIKMIRESHDEKGEERLDFSSLGRVLLAAVATSIDAVAVGASFGLTAVASRDFFLTAVGTFAATAIFAVLGMFFGSYVGVRWNKVSRLAAGIVLVIIGIRIMLME